MPFHLRSANPPQHRDPCCCQPVQSPMVQPVLNPLGMVHGLLARIQGCRAEPRMCIHGCWLRRWQCHAWCNDWLAIDCCDVEGIGCAGRSKARKSRASPSSCMTPAALMIQWRSSSTAFIPFPCHCSNCMRTLANPRTRHPHGSNLMIASLTGQYFRFWLAVGGGGEAVYWGDGRQAAEQNAPGGASA